MTGRHGPVRATTTLTDLAGGRAVAHRAGSGHAVVMVGGTDAHVVLRDHPGVLRRLLTDALAQLDSIS